MQSVIPIIAGILGGALFLLALIPAWIQGWRYTFWNGHPKPGGGGLPTRAMPFGFGVDAGG